MTTTKTILKPKEALNKAFRKVKPLREDIEKFKTNLIHLLDGSNDVESEDIDAVVYGLSEEEIAIVEGSV